MHCAGQLFLRVFTVFLLCSISLAQQIPTAVTIAYLSTNPQKLDGQLVRVRAILVMGWEGDNFLYDQPTAVVPKTSGPPAMLWFYCDGQHERQIYAAIKPGNRRVLGTFTGYFHFVPDKKSRGKDKLFDPGSLQFSATGVSDLEMQ